ncbi:MAG TPA: hydroxyisourate hydrolase [Pyrinomonadaceae bacterium]|nr:hydroxyisourate hydrolase [Pyrinomonadaceae bacterium]
MSAITTHVLDTSSGRPAGGVAVTLEVRAEAGWQILGRGRTDADGRLKSLLPADFDLKAGAYRLTFGTSDYFAARNVESFYPEVTISFVVTDAAAHYHVPLLVSPFGYSTYRGS